MLDQVTQLVAARDADPDLGFMARLLALCSLPRTNPKNRHEFKRVNGPYTLHMVAGGGSLSARAKRTPMCRCNSNSRQRLVSGLEDGPGGRLERPPSVTGRGGFRPRSWTPNSPWCK